MFGLPWWLWPVLVVVVGVLAMAAAARAWRASFRRQFVEYLRREAPDVEIVKEGGREIEIRTHGEAGTLRLARLFAEGARLEADDGSGREALFRQFLNMMREGGAAGPLDPERDRPRVLPRIVRDTFLARLRAELKDRVMPAVSLGVPGLSVVFVLDGESSVAYLTEELLAELGLTSDEALRLAKENLSRSFDAEVVRRALAGGSVNVIKSGDTFDAARLLLVPECMRESEEIVALIPDRDTLVLTDVPADRDWSSLSRLARTAAGETLWSEPLLVGRAGITAAPTGPSPGS